MDSITLTGITAFSDYLTAKNFKEASVQNYVNNVKAYSAWLKCTGREMDSASAEKYITELSERYKLSSVNSAIITTLNAYFNFIGAGIKLKRIEPVEASYDRTKKELTKDEYLRFLQAAQLNGDKCMQLILQVMYLMGLKVSELKFVTVDAARLGEAEIEKRSGRLEAVIIPEILREKLIDYAKEQSILSGSIFLTPRGKSIQRKNIREYMERLCKTVDIPPEKVCPDDLRALLAREFSAT